MSQNEMRPFEPRAGTGEVGGEFSALPGEAVDTYEPQGILEVPGGVVTPAGEAAPCEEQRAAGASNESTGPSGSQPLMQAIYPGDIQGLSQLIRKVVDENMKARGICEQESWPEAVGHNSTRKAARKKEVGVKHGTRKHKGPCNRTGDRGTCKRGRGVSTPVMGPRVMTITGLHAIRKIKGPHVGRQ